MLMLSSLPTAISIRQDMTHRVFIHGYTRLVSHYSVLAAGVGLPGGMASSVEILHTYGPVMPTAVPTACPTVISARAPRAPSGSGPVPPIPSLRTRGVPACTHRAHDPDRSWMQAPSLPRRARPGAERPLVCAFVFFTPPRRPLSTRWVSAPPRRRRRPSPSPAC